MYRRELPHLFWTSVIITDVRRISVEQVSRVFGDVTKNKYSKKLPSKWKQGMTAKM